MESGMTEVVYRNEGDVKKQVKKLLDKHRWFWWMPPGSAYGDNTVDFMAYRAGVFMVIETKFGKRRLTTLQRGFLTSIQAESGYAFVVYEHRLVWLAAWLDAFDRATALAAHGKPEVPEDMALMIDAIRELTMEIV
jgi:hypothetical protein